MANPFDAFDEKPKGNPFDAFDEGAGVPDANPFDAFDAKDNAPSEGYGDAVLYGIGQPLRNIGTTARVLGADTVGRALEAVPAPQNYQSASERVLNPKEGDFTVGGLGVGSIPRAAVEQSGQLAGSLISRVAGAGVGTAVGGVPGGVVGGIAGPTIFGAAQVIGSTALERAKANGRAEPNREDIIAAIGTGVASGLIDAASAKFLTEAAGPVLKRLGLGALTEGGTEALQSVIEQTGASAGTTTGLDVSPKQAIAEGLIGAGPGGLASAVLGESVPQKVEDNPPPPAGAPPPVTPPLPENMPPPDTVLGLQMEPDSAPVDVQVQRYFTTPEGENVVELRTPDQQTVTLLVDEFGPMVKPASGVPFQRGPQPGEMPPPVPDEVRARQMEELTGQQPVVGVPAPAPPSPQGELSVPDTTPLDTLIKLRTDLELAQRTGEKRPGLGLQIREVDNRIAELEAARAAPQFDTTTGEAAPRVAPLPGGLAVAAERSESQRIKESAGQGVALQYPSYQAFLEANNSFSPEDIASGSGISNEQEFLREREKEIGQFVEKPVQALVRKVYELGGAPYSSNAFGPGRAGVDYIDADGQQQFMPLNDDTVQRQQPTLGGTLKVAPGQPTVADTGVSPTRPRAPGATVAPAGTPLEAAAARPGFVSAAEVPLQTGRPTTAAERQRQKKLELERRKPVQRPPSLMDALRKIGLRSDDPALNDLRNRDALPRSVFRKDGATVAEALTLLEGQGFPVKPSGVEQYTAQDVDALSEALDNEVAGRPVWSAENAEVGSRWQEQELAREQQNEFEKTWGTGAVGRARYALSTDFGVETDPKIGLGEVNRLLNQKLLEVETDEALADTWRREADDDARRLDDLTPEQEEYFDPFEFAEADTGRVGGGNQAAAPVLQSQRQEPAAEPKGEASGAGARAESGTVSDGGTEADTLTDEAVDAAEEAAIRAERPEGTALNKFPAPFRQWFSGSKVVDEKGAPLVLYHGTANNVDNFFDNTFFGDRETASSYAEDRGYGEEGVVYPVYLSIKNPASAEDIYAAAEAVGGYDFDVRNETPFNFVSPNFGAAYQPEKVIAELKKRGFDGAIIDDDYSMNDPFTPVRSYTAFSGAQAKFAFSPDAKRQPMLRKTLGKSRAVADKIIAVANERLLGRNGQPMSKQEMLGTAAKINTATAPKPTYSPAYDLPAAARLTTFAQGVAANNDKFAEYHRAVLDEHYREAELIRQGEDQMLEAFQLPEASRAKINKVLEHDRLTRTNRKVGEQRVVVVMPENYQGELAKPGEVVTLSKEETKALGDIRKFLNDRWIERGRAMVAEAGYTGEYSESAIEAEVKRAQTAGKTKDVTKAKYALEIFKAVEDARRKGYVPFMRYGDVVIKITPKATAVPGKDGLVTPEGGRVEFVESDSPWYSVFGRKSAKSDAVNKRVAELEKRYPRDKFDYSVKDIRPSDIQSLDIPLIEKLFMAVNIKDPAVGSKLFSEVLEQVYKDRTAGIFRESRNVPGYSTDFFRSLADYNRVSSVVIAKMQHGQNIRDAYQATQKEGPGVAGFAKRFHEYLDSDESLVGRLKQFGFWANIWGSPSSALVNLIQTPTITAAQIGGWGGGRAWARVNGLIGSVGKALRVGKEGVHLDYDKIQMSPAERKDFMAAVKSGLLDPTVAQELQGDERSNFGPSPDTKRFLGKVFKAGASMFNSAEQVNRAVAWLATYRTIQDPKARAAFQRMYAKDKRVQTLLNQGRDTPADIARFVVEDTQFIGGKFDRPEALRGVGGVALQFKQYPLNYMRLLWGNFKRMGPEGRAAGLMMITTMLALSGVLGLPFAEDVLNSADAIGKFVTKVDPMLERELRNFIGDPGWAETILRGPSRAVTGVDLSKRFGVGEIAPEADLLLSIPILGATYGRLKEFQERSGSGQPVGAGVALAAPLVGKGPADLMRGLMQLPEEGLTTRRGDVKIAPDKITSPQMGMKATGLQPAKFARVQEEARNQQRLRYKTQDAENALRSELAGLLARSISARRSKDEAEANKFMRQYQERRREALANFRDEKVMEDKIRVPTVDVVRRRALQMLNPELRNKTASKTKRRALAEEDAYVSGDE